MLFVPLLPLVLVLVFVVLVVLLLLVTGTSQQMCWLESYWLQFMQLLVSALQQLRQLMHSFFSSTKGAQIGQTTAFSPLLAWFNLLRSPTDKLPTTHFGARKLFWLTTFGADPTTVPVLPTLSFMARAVSLREAGRLLRELLLFFKAGSCESQSAVPLRLSNVFLRFAASIGGMAWQEYYELSSGTAEVVQMFKSFFLVVMIASSKALMRSSWLYGLSEAKLRSMDCSMPFI